MKIDLNCDLGESFGNYKIGMDEEVIKYISSANIACGFHASDPLVMEKTVALAKENGVKVGAHPGFPDLAGFGRRNMNVSPKELKAMVVYQIGALNAFCKACGIKMNHVKPHGAMYNMAAKDERLAFAIAEAVAQVDESLVLIGLSGSALLTAAKEVGIKCASEVFADRAYEDDGSLVPRTKIGAVITNEEEASDRAVQMIKFGKVKSITGKEIPITADTICIHGDTPQALHLARIMRAKFAREMIEIEAL
ncbi:MAG: LamB/YcsF family protein [Treponema sp.]|nr:LamB/YcsF family protein [Treponema sp.]